MPADGTSPPPSPHRSTRRGAVVGAGAALAGAGIAALSTSTPAPGVSDGVLVDARRYNVVGDGVTDNHGHLQNFVQALASAGPGATGVLPPGTLLTSGPLAYGAHSGIHIVGNGRGATILTKTGNFDLVQMNGSGTGQPNHCSRCSLSNLGLSGTPPGGSTYTGRLIDCAYADNLIVQAVDLLSNNDVGIDMVETWDSHFDDIVCDAVSSGTAPSIWIRSSRAASGFGQSSDSTNVIRLTNIRCESWKHGAIRIEQGTGGTQLPNQIWLSKVKCESYLLRAPAISIPYPGASVVHMKDLYIFMGGFDSGFSTAQPAIDFRSLALAGSLRDCHIGNASAATVLEGVYALVGAPLVIDNVDGSYGAAPTSGYHVNLAGGGPYHIGACPVNGNNATPVHFAAGVGSLTWPYANSTIASSKVTGGSGETLIDNLKIPADTLMVGSHVRVRGRGQVSATSSTTLNGRIRVGEGGSTGDAQACVSGAVRTTSAAVGFEFDGDLTVQSAGSRGKAIANCKMTVGGRVLLSAQTAPVTIDTTVDEFVDLTLQAGNPSARVTVTNAVIEIVRL